MAFERMITVLEGVCESDMVPLPPPRDGPAREEDGGFGSSRSLSHLRMPAYVYPPLCSTSEEPEAYAMLVVVVLLM